MAPPATAATAALPVLDHPVDHPVINDPVLDRPVLDDRLAGCCSPVTGGILAVDAAERLARIFKALGDPTRVRLLSLIAAHADGEACVCDLTDPVGWPSPPCPTTSSSWSRPG